MKVQVRYIVTVSEIERRAIRNHYGKDGLATAKEVRDWFRTFGEGNEVLEDAVSHLLDEMHEPDSY